MISYHSLSIDECLRELKTSVNGLTHEEAQRRIKKYGLNKIAEKKKTGKLTLLVNQFKSPMVYILLVGGIIALILQKYIDLSVILGVVIINCLIGFGQEYKASVELDKLKSMIKQKVMIIRDQREKIIDASLLTIGDIMLLQTGNRIAADARLVDVNNLEIDEASLTGESLPVVKTEAKLLAGVSLGDRKNLVFAGTVVIKGQGKAVVTGLGEKTEFGQIVKMVSDNHEEKTPLQLKLENFSKNLALAALFISFFIIIIGLWQGHAMFEMLMMSVALVAAIIPEGLTIAITVILVLGMRQLLRQNVLTRKLSAAEVLGSTTVIATDKTGTLTQGKMAVSHLVIGDQEFSLNNWEKKDKETVKVLNLILQAAVFCNDAVIENPDEELAGWIIRGTPTEIALLTAGIQAGLQPTNLLKAEPKVAELPFDNANKFMITLNKKKSGGYILYEKGAAEVLINKSTTYYKFGRITRLNQKEKLKLNLVTEKLSNKGLRVIALAIREFDNNLLTIWPNGDWPTIDQDLIFIGFIALKDPLRPEAKETIDICKKAGIRPIIITGDHALTARAIAREVGLNAKEENIITGEELDKLSDEKFKQLVKKVDIYARVSPHHKLRIIKMLQARGEVVAMTGDGINDAPALKSADIGLSLGSATDIAKESSDMVLLDNNFKTIVAAVCQGRIIFSNIQKVITYLFSHNLSEVVLVAGSIFFGLPLAVLPVQILWINIVNDGLPNFSLVFEKGDKKEIEYKPVKKNASIMDSRMKTIIFGMGLTKNLLIFTIFLWFLYQGRYSLDYIRTVMFAILGTDSLIYVFSLRSFNLPFWRLNPLTNPYLLFSEIISAWLLLIVIYWPPLQEIFSTVALDKSIWLLIISIGIFSVISIELIKYWFSLKKVS